MHISPLLDVKPEVAHALLPRNSASRYIPCSGKLSYFCMLGNIEGRT